MKGVKKVKQRLINYIFDLPSAKALESVKLIELKDEDGEVIVSASVGGDGPGCDPIVECPGEDPGQQ